MARALHERTRQSLILAFGIAISLGCCRADELSLGEVARKARAAHKSTPTAKVIGNEDLIAEAGGSSRETSVASPPEMVLDTTTTKVLTTEAKAAQEQIRAQKKEISDIRGRIRDLAGEFVSLNAETTWIFAEQCIYSGPIPCRIVALPIANSIACGSTAYSEELQKNVDTAAAPGGLRAQHRHPIYYLGIDLRSCERARSLQAEIDSLKASLVQKQAALEESQQILRRKGYGNSIYDAD